MKRHDPYTLLLDELCGVNDITTDDQLRVILANSQQFLLHLREKFNDLTEEVDYSDANVRAAYLLGYYPHYIEPLFQVLNRVSPNISHSLFNSERVTACFFAAGPAPEILGWLSFLDQKFAHILRATAYIFDQYVWYTGLFSTVAHLAPAYWKGRLYAYPTGFNFQDFHFEEGSIQLRAISRSSLFVMQNCLNDAIGKEDSFVEKLIDVWQLIPRDALFVIVDLNYRHVQTLMLRLENVFLEQGFGEIMISANGQFNQVCSNIEYPEILNNTFFADRHLLRSKKCTRYYATVLQRVEEFPF